MAAEKYSASMDEELLARVREAAEDEDETLSAFLAEAAQRRVRHLIAGRIFKEWQEEHGAFTDEEMAQARHELANPMTAAEAVREWERRQAKKGETSE